MTYDSNINFTLDTICPWTYLAKRRLDKALIEVREKRPDVKFTVIYQPFQLFNSAPETAEDKYTWYKKLRYNDSEDQMQKYTKVMRYYGQAEGIDFKFGGTVSNTLNAHRVLQHFQREKGPEVVDNMINTLYRQYFEEEQPPAARSTMLKACTEAGISEDEAVAFIDDHGNGVQDVKMQIREQAGNGIDSVPYITIEGKRRDITLVGAKDVKEYVSALEAIILESK